MKRRRPIAKWCTFGLVFAFGCAQQSVPGTVRLTAEAPLQRAHLSDLPTSAASDGTAAVDFAGGETKGVEGSPEASSPQDSRPTSDRKIIYTANLAIEVERFDALPESVNRLAAQFGGYIASTAVSQLQGNRRSGSWTIRVPVDRYREFLSSASGLGVPQSLRENAQDVSEQFVDLEARIASGKKLEAQIMQLLEKQSDKIDDLLAVERELARVRLEIEQMEGRLRLLTNQVFMSTVHLTAQEKLTYLPPEQLSIGRRAALEWSEAVGRFGRFLEDSLIGLIANTFVILAWVLAGVGGWLAFRKWRRRRARAVPAEA